jgi:hypothetical protein
LSLGRREKALAPGVTWLSTPRYSGCNKL